MFQNLSFTLPVLRKCDKDTEAFIESSLQLGCEKIKILQSVNDKGFNMILKDIHNIDQKLKLETKNNNFADIRKILDDEGILMF